MGISKVYSEEDFVLMVLHSAKELYSESRTATYLSETRLNKLVCYVADKMNFDLTRGWYKYGIFSITAQKILPKGANLNSLNFDTDQIKEIITKFEETDIYKVKSNIEALRDRFITDKSVFYNWLYTFEVPKEYRDLYRANKRLISLIKYFLNILDKEDIKTVLKEVIEIKKCFFSLQRGMLFIERDDIWDNVIDYFDLLKMLFIKLENLGYNDKFQFPFNLYNLNLSVEDEIDDTLKFEIGDIWTTLVPYTQTVKGRLREQEIERHENKLDYLIPVIAKKINLLSNSYDEIGLLPSVEEIKEKIALIDNKKRKSIREIFGGSESGLLSR